MSDPIKINYIELPSTDLEASKRFFRQAFGWDFIDYGDAYCAFENAGIDGGFFKSEHCARTENGSALVVLYSDNLEASLDNVVACGASIVQDIFSFPGGRRFHFTDPSGNEWAIWSDK